MKKLVLSVFYLAICFSFVACKSVDEPTEVGTSELVEEQVFNEITEALPSENYRLNFSIETFKKSDGSDLSLDSHELTIGYQDYVNEQIHLQQETFTSQDRYMLSTEEAGVFSQGVVELFSPDNGVTAYRSTDEHWIKEPEGLDLKTFDIESLQYCKSFNRYNDRIIVDVPEKDYFGSDLEWYDGDSICVILMLDGLTITSIDVYGEGNNYLYHEIYTYELDWDKSGEFVSYTDEELSGNNPTEDEETTESDTAVETEP